MKIRRVRNARQLREPPACVGSWIGRGGDVAADGKADVRVDAVGLAENACGERGEAEARETRRFALAVGSRAPLFAAAPELPMAAPHCAAGQAATRLRAARFARGAAISLASTSRSETYS